MRAIVEASPAQATGRVSSQGTREGLECRVGRAAVAVPVASVEQIIEYDVASPVPLAKPWVAGMGTHAGRVVVCLSLLGESRDILPRRRPVKGILFRGSDRSGAGFLLEVSSVESIIRVGALHSPRAIPNRSLPAWLLEGSTADGRTLGFIDVEELFREFDQ
jgi:chemotaxis signal transduction protein